jgi:hypothetical protein
MDGRTVRGVVNAFHKPEIEVAVHQNIKTPSYGNSSMGESQTQIERKESDSLDEEYANAGRLIGTYWKFSDGSVQEVVAVQKGSETERGVKIKFPELRFDTGKELAFQSFRDSVQKGRVEPDTRLSYQIARHAGWE